MAAVPVTAELARRAAALAWRDLPEDLVERTKQCLLDGFELELFEEEEADSVTPRGNPKHWHIFHIVARKR